MPIENGKKGRMITRYCKECGEPFKETNRTQKCHKCEGKKKQVMARIAAQQNHEEKKEWQAKIIKAEINTEKEEEWTDETRDISTKQKCTTCKETHFKTDTYDHQYTGITEKECLTLNDVLRLMIEFEQEKEYKNTECLRFLNRKGLLRE